MVGYSPWCCKESDVTDRLSTLVKRTVLAAELPRLIPRLILPRPTVCFERMRRGKAVSVPWFKGTDQGTRGPPGLS